MRRRRPPAPPRHDKGLQATKHPRHACCMMNCHLVLQDCVQAGVVTQLSLQQGERKQPMLAKPLPA